MNSITTSPTSPMGKALATTLGTLLELLAAISGEALGPMTDLSRPQSVLPTARCTRIPASVSKSPTFQCPTPPATVLHPRPRCDRQTQRYRIHSTKEAYEMLSPAISLEQVVGDNDLSKPLGLGHNEYSPATARVRPAPSHGNRGRRVFEPEVAARLKTCRG